MAVAARVLRLLHSSLRVEAFPICRGVRPAIVSASTETGDADDHARHPLHVDNNKLADFEAYVGPCRAYRALRRPNASGYYMPTKLAGPEHVGVGSDRLPEPDPRTSGIAKKLASDPGAAETLRRAEPPAASSARSGPSSSCVPG